MEEYITREDTFLKKSDTDSTTFADNTPVCSGQSAFTPQFPEDFNVPDLKPEAQDTSMLRKASAAVIAGLAATVAAELFSFRKNRRK